MTPRRLLILGALAVVAIAIGLWISQDSTSSGSTEPNAPLYAQLQQQLDSVTAVKLFKGGDAKAVELQRGDAGWTVVERSGYPADMTKVRKLLRDLAGAKVIEEKTSNPENYATLGVEDVSQPNATGLRVELAGTSEPVNVIVGKMAPGAKSHYVRRAGEAQSWLVNKALDTSATADAWLRKDILDIAADRIQSATVTLKGAKSYTAAKSARADMNFSIEGLPKGKELASASVANIFGPALVNLTLTTIRPAGDFSAQAADASADFRTFDGLAIHIDAWKQEDKRYIAVKAAFDAAQAQRFHLPEAPKQDAAAPSSAPATPSAQPNQDQVKQEASAINDRLAAWVYQIPDYKYDAIFKPLDELLKR